MSLAEDPQLGGIHGRVADVFADADARRAAYLDLLLKKGGTCACGAAVLDAHLEEHPGVCHTCFIKRNRRSDQALLRRLEELRGDDEPAAATPPTVKTFTSPAPMPAEPPAPPAQESTMPRGKHPPCPGCGSTGRHKNVCPVKLGRSDPPAARSTPPSARPARIAIAVDLEALEVDELLARRATLREDLRAVDAALRARAEKLEEQRKAVLEAVADAA